MTNQNVNTASSAAVLTLGAGLGNSEFKFDFARFNLQNIDAGISTLKASGNTALQSAHEMLVFAIGHYVQHGDYTKIPALIDAINEGLGKTKHAEAIFYLKKNVPSLTIVPEVNKRGQVTGYSFTHQKGAERTFARSGNNSEGVSMVDMPFWKETDEADQKTVEFNFKAEFDKLVAKARKIEKRAADAKSEGKTDTVYKVNLGQMERIIGLVEAANQAALTELLDKDQAPKAA